MMKYSIYTVYKKRMKKKVESKEVVVEVVIHARGKRKK